MISVILNGFVTGLLLQIAIGPIFFFVLNISLQRTIIDGLFGVVGVTLADYIFIVLALLGVGKLLEEPKIKFILGVMSSIVLILFGIIMILTTNQNAIGSVSNLSIESNYQSSFLSAFLITTSSPLTIVFWTSLFATRAIEKGYSNRQLIYYGAGAGIATFVFLGVSITLLSLIKASIPILLLEILNKSVASILIIYGLVRLVKIVMNIGGNSMERKKSRVTNR